MELEWDKIGVMNCCIWSLKAWYVRIIQQHKLFSLQKLTSVDVSLHVCGVLKHSCQIDQIVSLYYQMYLSLVLHTGEDTEPSHFDIKR